VKRLRLGILLAILAGVSLWALAVHHRRAARTRWHKPLEVAVVILGEVPAGWQDGLHELERWIAREMGRYRRVVDDPPVRFHPYGPLSAAPPQFYPEKDDWWSRVSHTWRLSRALAKLDAQAGVGREVVHLYVLVERTGATPTVEGAGEVGGDAGFVRATLDEDLSMALTASAHELFHCLGAEDLYDQEGHALADDGLSPDEKGRFAEIMVGEIAPGRLPRSLDEVRVGKLTAAALHWSLTSTVR
jgi:hypothetical protein